MKKGDRHQATGSSTKAKVFGFALSALLLALGTTAQAQQPAKIPRIGYVGGTSAAAYAGRIEAFLHGLRELGYFDGKNVAIARRFAEGKADRLSELAAELVRLKVDVNVSAGPAVTRFLKAATSTIPIVMTNEGDPVGSGFVASLARPGGNITGLSALAPELSGKRLELLKETVPKLSRVAVLGNSTEPSNPQSLRELELAAGAVGVKVQYLDILSPNMSRTVPRRRDARRRRPAGRLQLPVGVGQRQGCCDRSRFRAGRALVARLSEI